MASIIDKIWFTSMGSLIGIVLVEDDLGDVKSYIGTAAGIDQAADAEKIADWGTQFPIEAAQVFFRISVDYFR